MFIVLVCVCLVITFLCCLHHWDSKRMDPASTLSIKTAVVHHSGHAQHQLQLHLKHQQQKEITKVQKIEQRQHQLEKHLQRQPFDNFSTNYSEHCGEFNSTKYSTPHFTDPHQPPKTPQNKCWIPACEMCCEATQICAPDHPPLSLQKKKNLTKQKVVSSTNIVRKKINKWLKSNRSTKVNGSLVDPTENRMSGLTTVSLKYGQEDKNNVFYLSPFN
ncbi:hypothetical protein HELRODRAFT_182493 [Helobdella robusta]|uniref:Uncharacterized protein n=1 Tax=Helobdella robusta TaxID=6412 RepID=T1FI96_HELRO|nr:hypothetical protein HELRODRAFT_182493 [Helobdella robusta]ESN90905.1 hypothetical protein HELRODRAFT_182493 [Helobdella robusta]